MCKFESSQKYESRWQSTDSSKAYRNTSAFKYYYKQMTKVMISHFKWNPCEKFKNHMDVFMIRKFQLSDLYRSDPWQKVKIHLTELQSSFKIFIVDSLLGRL